MRLKMCAERHDDVEDEEIVSQTSRQYEEVKQLMRPEESRARGRARAVG